MAASLIIFTGHPNADLKLKPTHARPRLCGSAAGLPLRTRPGYPIDTTSYFQSLVSSLTPETICRGVIFGPDGNFRGSFRPVARTLTVVPPTSTTSTFNDDRINRGFLIIISRLISRTTRQHQSLGPAPRNDGETNVFP